MGSADTTIAKLWLDLIGQGSDDPEATYRDQSHGQHAGTASTGRFLRDDLAVASAGGSRYRSRAGSCPTAGSRFIAEQVALQRDVTLKTAADAENQDDLRLEGWLTGFLEHPHIVTVHDAGDDFVVLQHLAGRSLKQLLGDLPLTDLIPLVIKVCDAIGYAHNQGVIHRDLKTSNILVGDHGEVLVINWGLACSWPDASSSPGWLPQLDANRACAGTPAWCPPEVATGRLDAIGPASDVFQLGAILAACVTGTAPFAGAHAKDCLDHAARNQRSPLPTNCPSGLADIITACCHDDPATRPDVSSLREQLLAWLGHASAIAEAADIASDLAARPMPTDYAGLRVRAAQCARGLGLDPTNAELANLAQATRLAFGRLALAAGDLQWAATQFIDHPAEREQVTAAIAEREQEQQRRRRLGWQLRLSAAAVIIIAAMVTGFIAVSDQRLAAARASEAADLLAAVPTLPAADAPDWLILAQQHALAAHQALGLDPTSSAARQRLHTLASAAVEAASKPEHLGIASSLTTSVASFDPTAAEELEQGLDHVRATRQRLLAERRQWITDLITRCTESIPWELSDPRVARDRPEGRRHEDDHYGVLFSPTVDVLVGWDGPETAELLEPLIVHPLPLCRRIAAQVLRDRPDLIGLDRLREDPDPAVRQIVGGQP